MQETKKRTRRDSGVGARPYRKNGKDFICCICGDTFYRKASLIKRGITKTCGKSECKSAYHQGEGNPFWGKNHTEEVKMAISNHRKSAERSGPGKGHGRGGPPKGYKHTPEARKKMSEALRKRWKYNRDVMLSYIQKEQKPRDEQRYRKNFTPWQRKNWKDDKCLWCGTTENLVLDHIIPVSCEGLNIKENSQTLCQTCNLWKSHNVGRPMLLAKLALQGGS